MWQPVFSPTLLAPAHPDSPLHGYHTARGYRFPWGHVLERVIPPDREGPDSWLRWDVVLEDAQAQYQALGGTLDELADMALVFLDTSMPQHAPRCLRYDDGAQPAAFGLLIPTTPRSAVRWWLWTLLTDGIPRLLDAVLAINAQAGHARRPPGERGALDGRGEGIIHGHARAHPVSGGGPNSSPGVGPSR